MHYNEHVIGNIDWKIKFSTIQKLVTQTQSSSKIVLKIKQFSQIVHVQPNYDFSRKNHKPFKAVTKTLPNINFQRGTPKLMSSIH